MTRIQSISRTFRIIFKILIVVVPILNILMWAFYDKLPQEVTLTLLPHSLNLTNININPTTKTLAGLICMLQVGVILYALTQLLTLFKNYERGEIFSYANTRCYRKLGYTLFAWVITDKIVEVLISLSLTFQNPVGHRQIAVLFDSTDLIGLIMGGLVIVIANIMNEGHKLNEEQALTI